MRKPVYDLNVLSARRSRLGELIKGGALILTAHPEYIRNDDVHHLYRASSNMLYLTGFDEPESILIFRPGLKPETILFVREKNLERETWDGFRFGVDHAQTEFQVDKTYPIKDFTSVAPGLLAAVDKLYYTQYLDHHYDQLFQEVQEQVKIHRGRSGRGYLPVEDPRSLIGDMRLFKEEYEMQFLRKAGQISAEAHVEVMKATKPGTTERALEGMFLKAIMERGCSRPGYGTIVAGGNNATTLHYVFNDQPLKDGDLLLIDAGGEFNYYTGDITRVYPVNGKFSAPQKRVYNKVLELQKNLIAAVSKDTSIRALQQKCISDLVDIMLDEKLLTGRKEDLITNGEYRKYYPHGVGHWLGMDVHDAGQYELKGEPRLFQKGMCFTIEPGLYIPANDQTAPKELRGIGIRIEDNIHVTDSGYEVLTTAAPKEVDDLENTVGRP